MHSWRDELKFHLKRHEGFDPGAYQDHLGFWTIGYGRLIDKRRGGGISQQEAEMLLDNDIEARITALSNRLEWFQRLPPKKKLALANMAYQLGVDGVFGFRRMLAAMKRADWSEAKREALDSKWARQTPERAKEVAGWIGEDLT
jgi:lysozyme